MGKQTQPQQPNPPMIIAKLQNELQESLAFKQRQQQQNEFAAQKDLLLKSSSEKQLSSASQQQPGQQGQQHSRPLIPLQSSKEKSSPSINTLEVKSSSSNVAPLKSPIAASNAVPPVTAAAPVRRQRPAEPSGGDIVDKLKAIVNPDDPSRLYREFNKIGQGYIYIFLESEHSAIFNQLIITNLTVGHPVEYTRLLKFPPISWWRLSR